MTYSDEDNYPGDSRELHRQPPRDELRVIDPEIVTIILPETAVSKEYTDQTELARALLRVRELEIQVELLTSLKKPEPLPVNAPDSEVWKRLQDYHKTNAYLMNAMQRSAVPMISVLTKKVQELEAELVGVKVPANRRIES